MTIADKLKAKEANELRLYKEGVFWIAYEEDAYLLSQVKKLKATKKYVKLLGMEIVSVGFPSVTLNEICSHFREKERTDTLLVLHLDTPADRAEFENWKQNMEVWTREAIPATTNGNTNDALLEKLNAFKLHLSSPMDCMRFVEELQREYC